LGDVVSEERVTRRLAAIVSADVVGYSRLIGRDEVGTLAALKELRREVVDPRVAEYHGRIVKTTGDGVLVEFASVVDAVRCVVEVQVARRSAVRAFLTTAVSCFGSASTSTTSLSRTTISSVTA
jgi:class 3 adenylate cyclase